MKKNVKMLLSFVLVLSMLIPVFSVFGVLASAEEVKAPDDGVSFSQDWYYIDGDLSRAPRTIQSWIYLPDENAKGIIIGGWSDEKHPYLSFEVIKSSGNLIPRLELRSYYNGAKQSVSLAFSEAKLPVGEWVNLAVVIDPAIRCAVCYVNGEERQSMSYVASDSAYNVIDLEERMVEVSMAVGNDLRNNYDQVIFKGKIANLSLYRDAKSASEIKNYYIGGADIGAEDIISYWDIEAAGKGNDVPNAVEGEPSLTYNKLWISEDELAAERKIDRAYSFAFIGDTQIVAENDANTGSTYLSNMFKWIADNVESKNIKHVVGLGDITDNSTAAEWIVAQDAISQLDGVVSYSLLRGNHDNLNNSDATRNIDTYFGPGSTYVSQFDGKSGALYSSSSMTNSWQSVTVGETKWLFVNLDYVPSDAVLDWAHKVIASHRDHKVIINTHNYLWCDGTTSDDMDWSNDGVAEKNNGDDIWNKLVSVHPNVTMVVSGHVYSNKIVHTQSKGDFGNTVTEFLIDQQGPDVKSIDKTGKPLALVAMFYFSEDGSEVEVEWYSTSYDSYFISDNQFTFDMNADCGAHDDDWNGENIEPSGSGTKDDPYIMENAGNLLWLSSQINQTQHSLDDKNAGVFADKYFKQICDIDLFGGTVKGFGYYYTTEKRVNGEQKITLNAFAGHYDGGGYSIKNGSIIPAQRNMNSNSNWSCGLFAVIFGATIENLTLDNIDIWSSGVTGGLVGRAVANTDGTARSDFNVISNCHVKESCTINSYLKNGADDRSEYDNNYHQVANVGSIAGMTMATTIVGCTSDVEIEVDGAHSIVGGIVGSAGYNTVIDRCEFTGGITLKDNASKVASSFGGIVGLLSPGMATFTDPSQGWYTGDNWTGTLKIKNCINTGYFVYSGSEALVQETYWGGIIGHVNHPYGLIGNDNVIENCYNLYEKKVEEINGTFDKYYIGGIVGKLDSDYATLYIKNCASVNVDSRGGVGTNEIRRANDNSKLSAETVATKTAEEMMPELNRTKIAILRYGLGSTSELFSGIGAPMFIANAGDMYVDSLNGDVYQYVTEWVIVGNIKGADGNDGKDGENGKDGADGKDGQNGADGKDGTSVTVTEVKKTGSEGLVDTYTIYFSDGTSTTFTITNGENGKDGADGNDGKNGKDGADGKDGQNGADGKDGMSVTVTEVKKTGSEGLVDTYTIYFSDGTSTTFTVTNGENGKDGVDGNDGENGKDGADGITPTIGENGNWYFGDTDSGKSAIGEDGESITVTEVKKTGSEGLVDTYTIYFSDGTSATFTVTNGKDASVSDCVDSDMTEDSKSFVEIIFDFFRRLLDSIKNLFKFENNG